MSGLDLVRHLERESARFATALRAAPPDAPVPSCPDWTADDLLWHLAGVQWFWALIVREGLTEPPPAEARPARPDGRAGLESFYEEASAGLVAAVSAASPDSHAWTWSTDRTVGFIRRRQAHEALIHRLDAELTARNRTPMDPQLSADGVDEALRIMYGLPPWGHFASDGPGPVRLLASDTGHSWLIASGRLTGTDPGDGSAVDEACLHVAATDAGGDAMATVTGSAVDLDCWLWRRPILAPLERSGDPGVLDQLESVLRPGID